MIIEIKDSQVEHKNGVGKTGQPYEIFTQIGYLHKKSEAYPIKVKLSLSDENRHGYPAGMYTLDEESFFVGDYDSLKLARYLTLVPTKSAKAAA